MYSLRMSFWTVPGKLAQVHALTPRHQHVQREQNRRGGIDGHRGGDLIEANAVEKPLHVGKGADGDAHATDFARGERMIRIHAHLRGKIEGHRETRHPLREQITVAPVALFGGAEAGVLAHGPQAGAVHVRVNAPREGELARQFMGAVHEREILRALRKEVTPKYAINAPKPMNISTRKILPSGELSWRTLRTVPGTIHAANTRKMKPTISFQRIRRGRMTPGTT